jgi:hypothetical protein
MNLRGLVQIVPCSYRQADYWRRQGWLGEECKNPGSGTGHGDLTPLCLKRALIIAACHDTGVRAREVAAALDKLDQNVITNLVSGARISLKLSNGIEVVVDTSMVPGWDHAFNGEVAA